MDIVLNGKTCSFPSPFTLKELLVAQSMAPSHVVVEINKIIIQSDRYNEVTINANDRIEILCFVGGG
jgi:thiamine biosynthesis protein ThiS